MKTNKTQNVEEGIFLTKDEYSLLIDGYCRQQRYNKYYIPIELCNIILLFHGRGFHYFIIFEKQKGNKNEYQTNELLCLNIYTKDKKIIDNSCWIEDDC